MTLQLATPNRTWVASIAPRLGPHPNSSPGSASCLPVTESEVNPGKNRNEAAFAFQSVKRAPSIQLRIFYPNRSGLAFATKLSLIIMRAAQLRRRRW